MKEAIILFSGGIDCSLVSLILRKQSYKLHLIHYNHGAVINNDLHIKRYEELKKVVGEEHILLKEINHSGIFRKLALVNIEMDFSKYHSNLICLGCRMAMHTETIIYAKRNNIQVVADGSIKYQNHFPEQSDDALKKFIKLYEYFDIQYITPIIDIENAKDVKYELLDNGISIQSMEDTCLFNNTFSQAKKDDIKSYINERFDTCTNYINDRLQLLDMEVSV